MSANIERRVAHLERRLAASERHEEGTRSLDDYLPFADDPVGFMRKVLRWEPWTAQVRIAEAVRDNPLVVVRSCNSMGKDAVAARLALWWVYARHGFVLVTGPTARQVATVVFGEIRKAWHAAADLPGELFETELRVDRTRQLGILGITSTEASKLTGFHAPRTLVIMTEAQACEAYAWEGMHSCATAEHDRFLALGNPVQPSGEFYRVSRAPKWKAIRVSAHEHPNVIEGREVIPGGVTREWIERIADAYGRSSGIYLSRVDGEFPTNSDDSLVEREWLDRAADMWEAGTLEPAASGRPYSFALDPARYGPDSTVLAVRQAPVLRELIEWRKLDTMQTTGRLIREAQRLGVRLLPLNSLPSAAPIFDSRLAGSDSAAYQDWLYEQRRRPHNAPAARLDELVIDDVGLGGGITDRLKEQGATVRPFNGGASPSYRGAERFLNARAESYFGLRTLLERERIALPRDPLLFEELLAMRFGETSAGKVQLEAKELVKKSIDRSPDRADAVSMCFYSMAVPPPPKLPDYLSVSYPTF